MAHDDTDFDYDDAPERDEVAELHARVRAAEEELKRERGKKSKRTAARKVPDHAPKPQDRQPKKLPQQDEVNDVEIVITAFGDEFRIRRSSLQDNWQFFAASAVGNIPAMLVQILGQDGFVKFCQRAMEAGKKPSDASREMWDLIGRELGVGGSGNS